ncbi:MAG: rhodanese-like domain-containing protein [Acetobacteraceae bacterium]
MRGSVAVVAALLLLAAAPANTARLPGGTVLDTPALAALIRAEHPLLIDVAPPPPRKPSGLAASTPWLPAPHHDIPGSVWLPDAGERAPSPALARWFRARLAVLAGRPDRPLVFYCHIHCQRSFDAALRAIDDGYSRVYWYPLGIEGWTEAGQPSAPAKPVPAEPAH